MWHAHTFVFDLDDTLFAERSYVRSGFAAVGHRVEQLRHTDFARIAWELFLAGHRGHVFDATLARLGIAASPQLIGHLLQVYREHRPQIALYPDVQPMIDALRPHARLAIVSDGPLLSQQRKIEALGLKRLFDPIVLSDRWGPAFWKPHDRAFRTIEAATGRHGADCVYVGDNPAKDFIAPRRLGWWTVRVRRPGGEHSAIAAPDAAHAECRDLRGLLARIRARGSTGATTGAGDAEHTGE